MVLIDHVISHAADETECALDVSASGLFAQRDGCVPSFLALEYMAQTIAAHAGLVDLAARREPRPGVLVGSRKLQIAVDRFEPQQRLRVNVRRIRGLRGMAVFDCDVRDETDNERFLVNTKLNVYAFESYEAMLKGYKNDK
jgi:predicted hotdog family 3-hydroxylacyl-ACP dehydratase